MVKKSVPKEEIDKIVEEYGCTPEKAAEAYLESQSARDEIFDYLLRKNGDVNGELETPESSSYTPHQIKEYLDKYIIGQDDYKKRLAIAAAYHFAMVKARNENKEILNGFNVKRWRKKNTLIAGPSGSGKTYCVEVLADLLNVPVNVVDATDYTESGYVGKSADDMIRELISMAPGDTKHDKADYINSYGGLIFIDEMDKKAKEGGMVGIDVSREGFQRAVLKLVERKLVPIDDPSSPASQIQEMVDQQRGIKGKKKDSMISTENILFILGGSFQRPQDSIEKIVKKRLDSKDGRVKEDGSLTISGFVTDDSAPKKEKYKSYYKYANEDDYIRFGLIPELVGRTPIRAYVNALSKNDLVRIMTETEDSILNQYKLEFKLFGIDIDFTPDAIDEVAGMAEEKKTGARALVSEWESILTDFQFELPGANVKAFEVNGNVCRKPQDEVLKLMERSPINDYIDRFNRNHSIALRFTDDAVKYVEKYAKERGMQISHALERLLGGATALNYMNVKGEFVIEDKMLKDEKYFDNLYVEWHQKQMGANL